MAAEQFYVHAPVDGLPGRAPLLAYGHASRADRRRAAQASGNRMTESYLAVNLSTFGADDCAPTDTFDFLAVALNNL